MTSIFMEMVCLTVCGVFSILIAYGIMVMVLMNKKVMKKLMKWSTKSITECMADEEPLSETVDSGE